MHISTSLRFLLWSGIRSPSLLLPPPPSAPSTYAIWDPALSPIGKKERERERERERRQRERERERARGREKVSSGRRKGRTSEARRERERERERRDGRETQREEVSSGRWKGRRSEARREGERERQTGERNKKSVNVPLSLGLLASRLAAESRATGDEIPVIAGISASSSRSFFSSFILLFFFHTPSLLPSLSRWTTRRAARPSRFALSLYSRLHGD